MKTQDVKKQKKKFYVPNTYTLIMIFIMIAAIATYIVPAGQYNMIKDPNTGKSMIDASSFSFMERTPVSIGDFLLSIPKGMNAGAAVIFLTFLVGGFFQVVNDTGAIDIAINASVNKLQKKALLVIPIIMVIMSVLGSLGIVVNAVIAFIPIGIALSKKLKLDPLVGIGIMYLGAYSGFAASPMGPYNTIIGQTIAGLPLLSGFGLRAIVWAILFLVTTWYVYRYANKVQKDPNGGVLGKLNWDDYVESSKEANDKFTIREVLVLLTLIVGFIVYGYGAYKLKWGLNQLSAMMLAVALISGLVGRMHPDDMAKSFIKGAQSMVYGALVIGFAKSITIILTDGHIIHSIIYYMTIPLTKVPPMFSAIGMFLSNLVFNFVVPSGSGQAMIVMPLMSPMADVVGVTRQIAVSAYQYGDGFSNIIIPTSGVLMAALGVAKVPYEKWLKFVAPIFLIWSSIGVVVMVVATLIGWS
ncbi:YfcC family protein [Clostridium oceanicum]|uniref:YfcC family protein n=1 Tax=Clostridium oceanicum TaxID=1543 RepID=A0ABN1JCI9_9CLOT